MTFSPAFNFPGLAGPVNSEPHLICNACRGVFPINMSRAIPKWLIDNKAPRGWSWLTQTVADKTVTLHFCPVCTSDAKKKRAPND